MKLTQIIRNTLIAGVLAISGCTYFNHIPDSKIENVVSKEEDADWAKKYRGMHYVEIYDVVKQEPFDKMSAEELREKIKTPFEAQIYVFWLNGRGEGLKRVPFKTTSFPETHKGAVEKNVNNDCSEGAVAVAYLLSDNRYMPLILRTEKRFGNAHECFILKENGKFHTVGTTYAQKKFPEGHESVHELVKKQFYPLLNRFSVYDLSEYHKDWKTSKKNLHVDAISTERVK